ncbi:hypothetical protein B0H14DRAFT_2745982 [Mycena olivaceomarginata]|nr:hypothetical protein B0H14DRAFT_2882218 [Mycena olivaceomarginata]KAJ7859784.1 hypothetical protein B0H14DRAFT_2745982 [Mycena olivaceomarginata]
MTVLLTGGTGKSATPLANLLLNANVPLILATRSGKVPAPFRGARFDWLDASTYQIPFDTDSNIDRIYLIPPPVLDMFPPMKAFIDFAIQKGVKRFVLMSAALLEEGGPAMGKVHEYLHSRQVEYCVLRPSWFFDNLRLHYADYIRKNDEIVNAAGSGLIGWISTEDIADVAFKALTDQVIEHTNPVMVGPELWTYAQIAQLLSDALGRKITHRSISGDEYTKVMVQRGMPEDYAAFMSNVDVRIAGGLEEKAFHRADFVGKRRLQDFIAKHKDAEEWKSV